MLFESKVKAAVLLTINGTAAWTSFQDSLCDTFIFGMAYLPTQIKLHRSVKTLFLNELQKKEKDIFLYY